jgi:hypothetical protein
MSKKLGMILLAGLIGAGFSMAAPSLGATENARATASPTPVQAGYALLDQFVDTFHQVATEGTGSLLAVEERLQAIMALARKDKDGGKITPAFFARFNRLLAVTKLVMAPDEGGILVPVIGRTLEDFVGDMTGESLAEKGGPKAIGAVANAIAEEIVNLQIYLDTLDKREALRKKLDERASGPVKK